MMINQLGYYYSLGSRNHPAVTNCAVVHSNMTYVASKIIHLPPLVSESSKIIF
jgi:hypothetical protein